MIPNIRGIGAAGPDYSISGTVPNGTLDKIQHRGAGTKDYTTLYMLQGAFYANNEYYDGVDAKNKPVKFIPKGQYSLDSQSGSRRLIAFNANLSNSKYKGEANEVTVKNRAYLPIIKY